MIHIPEDQSTLVTQFVEQYYLLKSSLAEQKLEEASTQYKDLLSIYQKINDASLAVVHKEMAYHHLTEVHEALTKVYQEQTAPQLNYVAIALVFFIISTAIVLQPKLVGLAVYDGKHVISFHQSLIESTQHLLKLKGPPSSFIVTGSITGKGRAKLFLVSEKEKRLIFDNYLTPLVNNTFFTDTCIETCSLSQLKTNEVTLVADIDGPILSIDTILYEVDNNQPPVFTSKTNIIHISEAITINLRDYFSDPDDDPLAFVVIPTESLHVQLTGSQLTITSKEEGTHPLTIIASDPKSSTRVTLDIII